ncbi:hypothetical protein DOM22_10935 [Bdellovibrio sp. ZAP7]|uniref:hypothetical protein n=1 Tax=Bdellovibrio sp. ZAP7 TaxID=2231053 RepID=UPI00115C0294|nr:hypothetical protein [Bdellovibrio sp. ZAP7]QDK45626.1 hypothetical protein DOM22_10935 [Bdellovibrio sp. ZAP7]
MKFEGVVSNILLSDWDPIGVRDNPHASAEYDCYALRVVGMLHNGANSGTIAEYLMSVEKDELEVKVDDRKAKMVAEKILNDFQKRKSGRI